MRSCEICKKALSMKIKKQHIAFVREGVVQEKYLVCPECYNKYALQIRNETVLENPTPEEIAVLHRSSAKTSVTVKNKM